MHIEPQDWLALLPGTIRMKRKTDNGEDPKVKFNPMELVKLAITATFYAVVIVVTLQRSLDEQTRRIDGLLIEVKEIRDEQVRRTAPVNWAEHKMEKEYAK